MVTGAKWVAGWWLSSRLEWHVVEVHVCVLGSGFGPRAKAGLNLAVLQPKRGTRLGHEHWWKFHPAQQVNLSGSAVLLSCFLCLEAAFLSSLRCLGHLLGPKGQALGVDAVLPCQAYLFFSTLNKTTTCALKVD